MKLFNNLLVLTLVIGLAGACTKLEESPEPGTGTTGGTGGGGATGDPAVYLGVWKQTDKKKAGTSIFDANNTFTVKLDAAATATWTFTDSGVVQPNEPDAYILKTTPLPATIDFVKYGSREIVSKTGSLIIWQWNDPKEGGALVEETLTKQ
ncbi:MAG TPA: hypothetical protein DIW47_15405 [Bacteroidetes bacterium]|nr:hypothetical protein [Bacteroidota bacterium]